MQTPARIAIYTTMAYATILFILVTIANGLFRAPPAGRSWDPDNFIYYAAASSFVNKAYGFFVLCLDIIIFIIPIRASWSLAATFAWKCKVSAVFLLGFL